MWDLETVANTLTPDDKDSLDNAEMLKEKIQIQLSKELKIFLNFSLHFWRLHLIFNISEKKLSLIAYVFPKLQTVKDGLI